MKQNILKAILFCISVFALVALPIKYGKTARDNPMQRYIVIKNDFSKDIIYPVIESLEQNWGTGKSGVRRIYVNVSSDIKGVPPGKQLRVNLPAMPWYNGRVYLFSVDPRKYEALGFDDKQQSKIDPNQGNPCAPYSCEVGYAAAGYNDDNPSQLIEYTIDALDPKTGAKPANGNFDDPSMVSMVDVDVSYVDAVYLPVAISLDDKGVTGYMGTLMPFDIFKDRTMNFLKQARWSMYAAYTPANWNNNVFHDLINSNSIYYQLPSIPSGNFIFNSVRRPENQAQVPMTELYGLKGSVMACNAKDGTGAALFPLCSALAGNCCASDDVKNGFNIFLDCCPQKKFLLDNTKAGEIVNNLYTANNDTVEIYAKRWKAWIDSDPCSDINKISKWPSSAKEFDNSKKLFFCSKFRDSVRFIWDHFKQDSKEPCNVGTAHERDICVITKIIAYKVPENTYMSGKLPETLQAILRGVPYVAASYDLYVVPKRDPADKSRRNTFLITQDEQALYELDENGDQKLILDRMALPPLLEKIKPGNKYLTDQNHPLGWSIKDDFTDEQLTLIDNAIQSKYKLPDSMLVPPSNYPIDKWLVFWNTYDTDEGNLFSLNPYTHFVHDEKDGINAQSYSFSIDDKYGNFRDRALGFIIDVGGSSAILNLNMYDPFDQYKINWAGNPSSPDQAWQQVSITPSDSDQGPAKGDTPIISIDKNQAVYPMNAYISFNRYGDKNPTKKFSYVTLTDAQGNHLDFKMALETKTVKDNFTGITGYVIHALSKDDKYCESQSSDILQSMCKTSNLSALNSGEIYYPQLFKEDRPKVNLNVGLPNKISQQPVFFPEKWIKGVMADKTKATISWPEAKLNAAAKKAGSTIAYRLLAKDGKELCTFQPATSCSIDANSQTSIPLTVVAYTELQGSKYQDQIDATVDLLNPSNPTMTWDDYSEKGAFDIAVNGTSAVVKWKAAAISNNDAPQYSVILNGNAVAACTNIQGTSCTLNDLKSDMQYAVNVTAVDSNASYPDVKQTKLQNFSTAASSYSINWPGDISIVVNGNIATISWQPAVISDGSQAAYSVLVQGRNYCTQQTVTGCIVNDWKATDRLVGVYAFKVGNLSKSIYKEKAYSDSYTINWPGDISITVNGNNATLSWQPAVISDGSQPGYSVLVEGRNYCTQQKATSCAINDWRSTDHRAAIFAFKLGDLAKAIQKNKNYP